MFAKIATSKSIRNTLRYNEQKIEQGTGECLLAENFAKDLDRLTIKDKLFHFERRTSLNEESEKVILHISLNFHPSDKLSNTQMESIAREYMQKMDMDRQPFLVYRHDDSGHPHVHIVSIKLRPDGSRIHMSKRALYRSHEITRQMEIKHALVPSQKRSVLEERQLATSAQRIEYGQSETRQAISDVLDVVIPQYKYTSLDELNAVLRLYNLRADRPRDNPLIHPHKDILYRVLDENGNRLGVPQKASSFDSNPTLKTLEEKFVLNEPLREPYRERVKAAIDWTLLDQYNDLPAFKEALREERISAVFQEDKKGGLQGIYYVDHATRCVFDGESLGGQYTAAAMRERCTHRPGEEADLEQEQIQEHQQRLRIGGL